MQLVDSVWQVLDGPDPHVAGQMSVVKTEILCVEEPCLIVQSGVCHDRDLIDSWLSGQFTRS